jgi:hypothetical protein
MDLLHFIPSDALYYLKFQKIPKFEIIKNIYNNNSLDIILNYYIDNVFDSENDNITECLFFCEKTLSSKICEKIFNSNIDNITDEQKFYILNRYIPRSKRTIYNFQILDDIIKKDALERNIYTGIYYALKKEINISTLCNFSIK